MIREDIRKEHRASSQRSSLRYAASAIQMSSPQVAENHLLLGRQSFLAPRKSKPKTQNMATLEITRASAFGRGRYHSRDSPSNMERTSQPPSRPSTMRGRQSFSSSFNQPKAEPLFVDTPDDPGTSFVFPSSKTENRPAEIEESRPVSHAGSIFSVRTAMSGSADDACPQVDFGRPLPQGYQKIPAYTIRRIERNDAFGLDSMGLPTLPDSPIGFEMRRETGIRENIAQPSIENGSRASRWSTKVQTTAEEFQEQETLVEDPPEERKKDNFAFRGCQKLVRALSNRIASDSLGRFRSRRWKADRGGTITPGITAGNGTLALGERQVNIRQESGQGEGEHL